ncbi:hypothetical protein ACHAXR_008946 [Thalassiosira sp. AJA248-18]
MKNVAKTVLSILIKTHFSSLGAVAVDSTFDGGDADASREVNNNDVPLHITGGLRWRDLGVSLEPCPLTTVLMLDKFDNNNDISDGYSNIGGSSSRRYQYSSDKNHQHCLDDSEWLLHPSTGFVENGSLCGIIGPSGAGKTTFLSALGGTTPRSSGVYLTGSVWYEDCLIDNDPSISTNASITGCQRYHLSQQEGEIALLSQHDNFFDMLTPRESLEFAAYLEHQKHVDLNHKEVAERKLASLGLLGVADRRIGDRTKIDGGGGSWGKMMRGRSKVRRGGGLSGGERRRLSVALELITEPKIFLADEPTTGLDSSQAEKVVKLISRLAKERNVPSVCTLHQPKSSIWRTLDQFILLAPGGKMCYAGTRRNATDYFATIGHVCPHDTNPAEFFIDLVTIDTEDPVQAVADKTRIDLLHHRFLESCIAGDAWQSPGFELNAVEQQEVQTKINSSMKRILRFLPTLLSAKLSSTSNAVKRFGALLLRSWRQNVRNERIILLRLVASVVQAGLFASIFTSVRDDRSLTKSIADRVALLTFGVINMSIMALMKTLDLFARERSVVMREQMRSSYSSLEYLLAKLFAEIPLDSFFALVFATILKRLTGLRTSMLTLIKTYCLMTVTSVSLGFAIGSITSSVESAMSLGVPVMVIFMVVGVINPSGVDSNGPPNRIMEWLKVCSPIKWAIEALVTAEFRGMVFDEKERGRWGQLKDLPRMGALAMVQDGGILFVKENILFHLTAYIGCSYATNNIDNVLANLGLGTANYSDLMEKLGLLSGVYLLMSWLGLSFFGPSFMDTE